MAMGTDSPPDGLPREASWLRQLGDSFQRDCLDGPTSDDFPGRALGLVQLFYWTCRLCISVRFTLIELLVVISVILIASSLIFIGVIAATVFLSTAQRMVSSIAQGARAGAP